MSFREEEINKLARLMAKITQEAKFELSMNSFVELFNELDWVRKTLIPKLKEHVFEIEKLHPPQKKEIGNGGE